jgi:trimethylamine:corrinoid methyltransferase-like protein
MFRSVAKRPNAQAACERTASVFWQALLGARHFGAVGQLSIDEVFSPQQAVLDREILRYVERVIQGLDLQPSVDAIELIREGVQEGYFVGAVDTVGRFRDFYRFPDILRHWSLGRWRAEGEPAILEQAWAHARDEIRTSTCALEEDRQLAVAGIYDRACSYVQGRS